MPDQKDPSAVLTQSNAAKSKQGPEEGQAEAVDFRLDESAQALIGHHLRTLYGEIVREPVPDHLLQLLQDLERKEQQ